MNVECEYELNLEWFEDTENVYNDMWAEDDSDSWNDEKVWKSWFNGFQVFVFPVRDGKKIIGYAFDVDVFDEMDRRVETEWLSYNSLLNDDRARYYRTEDDAIIMAERYLKENIEGVKIRKDEM